SPPRFAAALRGPGSPRDRRPRSHPSRGARSAGSRRTPVGISREAPVHGTAERTRGQRGRTRSLALLLRSSMYPRSLAFPLVAAAIACSPHAAPPQEKTPMKKEPGPMTPYPEIRYTRGPAANSAPEALQTWLEAQVAADGSPKLVRLPVTLTFSDGKLGIAKARVGTFEIPLSDSGLGVS